MLNKKLIKQYIFEDRDSWKDFRKYLFTSSNINNLMAAGKSANGLSVGAVSYIVNLIKEQISEPSADFYNEAMEWGNEQEPQAFIRYCENYDLDPNDDDVIYTSVGGFVFFTYNGICGGTPDVILKDAIIEIKCPNSDTHIYSKLFVTCENFKKEYPKYYDQMQWNMFLCQKKTGIFMSYDSRQKEEGNQTHYITIEEDLERQEAIYLKIEAAHKYKTELLAKLSYNTQAHGFLETQLT